MKNERAVNWWRERERVPEGGVRDKRGVLSRDGRKPDGETFYVCRVTVTSGVGWPEAHRCRLNGATKTEWVI